jgi:hypothetical protein
MFNRDPAKTAAKGIDAAKSNLDRLRGQLADAEAAIATHKEQAKTAAVTGADSHVLDLAEIAIRAAQDRTATLTSAIATVSQQLAALETAHSAAQDKEQREATAQSVEILARRVLESADALVKAAAAFGDHVAKAAAFIPEANGLMHFATIVGNEIPAATSQTAKLLRQHSAAVLRGSAASILPQPQEAHTEPPPPAREATQTLFCCRSIKWVDDQGRQKIAAQFTDAEIPARLVGKALRIGACVGLDHPSRKTNQTQGSSVRNPAAATDLDVDEQPRLVDPILQSSPFEKAVIGPPRVLKVATTRSEPT